MGLWTAHQVNGTVLKPYQQLGHPVCCVTVTEQTDRPETNE